MCLVDSDSLPSLSDFGVGTKSPAYDPLLLDANYECPVSVQEIQETHWFRYFGWSCHAVVGNFATNWTPDHSKKPDECSLRCQTK